MGSAPTIEPSDARAWTLSDVFAAWASDRERLCDNLEELLAKAEREPLGVDISDFSDEFCAGFLRGQLNVLELLLRDPPLPDRRGAQAEPSTAPPSAEGDVSAAGDIVRRMLALLPAATTSDAQHWSESAEAAVTDALAALSRLEAAAAEVTNLHTHPVVLEETAKLVAQRDALAEALRQTHHWISDALESTGDSDEDLILSENGPGAGFWARLISARDTARAALATLGEREPKGREAGGLPAAPPPGAEYGDVPPQPLFDSGSPTRSSGSEGGSRSPNGGGPA